MATTNLVTNSVVHGRLVWVKSGASAILAVSSVIIPRELNYLINPRHPDFAKIKIEKSADFAFDQKLFQ
jgi:RES domain-containing protein